ncbi:MAG: hypothetical protein WAS49_11785, partial [Candidatus Dechloromonas phosphoritropha]
RRCAVADDPSLGRIPASLYALNHPRKNPLVSNTLKSATPTNIDYVLSFKQLKLITPDISGQ